MRKSEKPNPPKKPASLPLYIAREGGPPDYIAPLLFVVITLSIVAAVFSY